MLLGAGTGLGVALLVWSGERMLAVPSEGGHAELAARDEEEWALRRFLAPRCGGRVSVERVVSGMGLRNLYDFLVDARRARPSAQVAAELAAGEDAGQVHRRGRPRRQLRASARASSTSSPPPSAPSPATWRCSAALAAASTSAAASRCAWPKKLADGTFLRAFLAKGRLTPFVERVPVQILTRPDTAIWGAARRAAELAGGV